MTQADRDQAAEAYSKQAEVFVNAAQEALSSGATFEDLWRALSMTVSAYTGYSPRQQALAAARALHPVERTWLLSCLTLDDNIEKHQPTHTN